MKRTTDAGRPMRALVDAALSVPGGVSTVIAVDPGTSGAIAALRLDGSFIDVRDLPIHLHGKQKWIAELELRDMVSELAPDPATTVAYMELTSGGWRSKSVANSQGQSIATVRAVLRLLGYTLEYVPPQTWKAKLGLSMPKATYDAKKFASLCRARELYPRAPLARKCDHDRAEALLLARYGLLHRHLAAAAAVEVSRPRCIRRRKTTEEVRVA